jgi:hypothetical protein
MSANKLDNKQVSLRFYSGPSAPPPCYMSFQGTLKVDRKELSKSFENQQQADRWAAEIGVQRWVLTEHCRAFPEAWQIPIRFPNAPDDDRLRELVSSFASGTPLRELAKGVMVTVGLRQFEVHPNLLRLWLIGVDPNHPALQRLRHRR